MKSITFLGASSDIVTGSSYIVTHSNGTRTMIDMGMFQGDEKTDAYNYKPLIFDPKKVQNILLTHAHLDHVGRLPMMVKHGFRGNIYMTAPTKALAEVVLLDSAKIALNEHTKPILFNEQDVYDTLNRIKIIQYDEVFQVNGTSIKYKDAGHILGSASISMWGENKKLIFSGDLGNSPDNVVRPTDYFEEGEYVVMESTYGDKNHPHDNPDETIQKEINLIEQTGATLLIPSFSIERTQVLLHKIDHMKKEGKVKNETKVYLDSPMGIKATDIYRSFPELFNDEMQSHTEQDEPFEFPGLNVIESPKDSKKIKKTSGPKVIIAGSGMMAGGRILNHAIDFLPIPSTRLLIVGFQAEGTHGKEITMGAKSIKIYDQTVAVKASVTELYSMSAHADQDNLMKWIEKVKGAKKVFLTHGEKVQRETLSEKIKKELGITSVERPSISQTFEL